MTCVPRPAIFLGVVALGLVWSAGYANSTIKVTLLDNAIQLDASRVKAGTVTFEVSNAWGTNLAHKLVVLKTDLAADRLPIKGGQVLESRFKKMGEAEDMAPGKNRRLTLKLAPGRYVLICSKSGHYSMGMHTSSLVGGGSDFRTTCCIGTDLLVAAASLPSKESCIERATLYERGRRYGELRPTDAAAIIEARSDAQLRSRAPRRAAHANELRRPPAQDVLLASMSANEGHP